MGVLSPVGNHTIAEQADEIIRMPKHGNTSFLFDSCINAKKVTSDLCGVMRRLLTCCYFFVALAEQKIQTEQKADQSCELNVCIRVYSEKWFSSFQKAKTTSGKFLCYFAMFINFW